MINVLIIEWTIHVHKVVMRTSRTLRRKLFVLQLFCEVLLILKIYVRSATYFWMFVEGLNILIPLCRAFQEKIQRRWFYFIGWGR